MYGPVEPKRVDIVHQVVGPDFLGHLDALEAGHVSRHGPDVTDLQTLHVRRQQALVRGGQGRQKPARGELDLQPLREAGDTLVLQAAVHEYLVLEWIDTRLERDECLVLLDTSMQTRER